MTTFVLDTIGDIRKDFTFDAFVPMNGHTKTESRHYNIVALETFFGSIPDFTAALPGDCTYSLTTYECTPATDDAVAPRVRCADIVLLICCPMSSSTLKISMTPRLKFISTMGSGYDSVDLEACRERGIVVSNSPRCNTAAAAEHALGMYFAVRRSMVRTHMLVRAGLWQRQGLAASQMVTPDGQAPISAQDEVVGIIGYGAIGKQIEELCRRLGMLKILIAARKGDIPCNGRVDFFQVIKAASLLFVAVARTPETLHLFSEQEFKMMRSSTVLVNISRGGIVSEVDLVDTLTKGGIAGAASDVFLSEPANPGNSVLLGKGTEELNLLTTPHVAWVSRKTTDNFRSTIFGNVAGFLHNKPQNVVS